MMRDPEQTIGNLIDRRNTSFVGSVDEDGYPEVKAMLPPRKREGIRTFYFTSNTSSMRAAHYRAHPQACIYFVDRRFFVIADEAFGAAQGEVALHYNLVECDPAEDFAAHSAATRFDDGNNLLLKVFGAKRMERREGWVSRTYRQRAERPAYTFTVQKRPEKPVRLVTVLLPAENAAAQRVKAVWHGDQLQVKINRERYNLK